MKNPLSVKFNLFFDVFFPSREDFLFWRYTIYLVEVHPMPNTNQKISPSEKKEKTPTPPKEFSHGTPKSMGFSVDVFFFPFPRGPLFSASICGVGRNHAFDGWIIQEVDLVEDFHGAVWRLPDGEMARWLLGGAVEGAFFLFLVGPVVTEISSSN